MECPDVVEPGMDRSATIRREGSWPRARRVRCHVMAMAEPPAPMHEHLGAGPARNSPGPGEAIERQAGRDRVLSMADQPAVALDRQLVSCIARACGSI